MTPKDAFRNFLEKAEADAWIASYKWFSAESFLDLREQMKGSAASGISRTHKRGTDGVWWGLEVEGHEGTGVGVDLEIFVERPVLNEPSWITGRLGLPRNTTPNKILEEWCVRESAFKSLAPNNDQILLSHFKRSAPNTLSIYSPKGDLSVQIRSFWSQKWVLSLAWRSA